MQKIILTSTLLSVFTLSGCTTRNITVTPSPISGSKADGVVVMGYTTSSDPYTTVNTTVNWDAAKIMAKKKCKTWGYSSSEKFGDFQTTTCQHQEYDAFLGHSYCAETLTTVSYQCID